MRQLTALIALASSTAPMSTALDYAAITAPGGFVQVDASPVGQDFFLSAGEDSEVVYNEAGEDCSEGFFSGADVF